MKDKKSKKSPMDKLTAGYENFIKGKQLNEDGKQHFAQVVKRATQTKQRGSK